ncbi:MAG: bifunctional adenosylcobinamide kinase/adenosylcobinamide-phosphate guanylyltransferase [Acidimicrobiales bacterium]
MIVLVLGGARSGKSAVAEGWAAALAGDGPVSVLATAVVADDDMAARVAAHRARRPPGWDTVEAGPDLAGALRTVTGVALVDSLGTWLAQAHGFQADVEGLCAALSGPGHAVAVSEEAGLGVHPSTAVGLRFRDALGIVNQAVAAVADEVVLVVAGRVLRLDAGPTTPAALRAGASHEGGR